jgi:rhodanese-related sulfurtransferase
MEELPMRDSRSPKLDTPTVRSNPRRFLAACVALALGAALAAAPCHAQKAKPTPSIAPQQLYSLIQAKKAPVILDVRTPKEFASGHIQGAVNIPVTEVQKRLPELQKYRNREIVVHCEGGGRAAKAEKILRHNGFSDVVDLQGSMRGWKDKGLPTER